MSLSKKQTEKAFEKYLKDKEEGTGKDAWTPDVPDIPELPEELPPEVPEPDLMEEALQEMEAAEAEPDFPQGDPEPPKPEAQDSRKLAFEYIADKWGRTKEEARRRLTEAGHDAQGVFDEAKAILTGK